MTDSNKYKISASAASWLSTAFMAIVLYAFVATVLRYQLCQMEHVSIHYCDWGGLVDAVTQWGGLSRWLAGLLISYFPHKVLGPLMFCLPFYIIIIALQVCVRQQKPIGFILAMMVSFAQLFSQIDFDYSFSGSVSAAMVAISVAALSMIENLNLKYMTFVLLIPVLYWFGSSDGIIFYVIGIIIMGNCSKWICSILLPSIAVTAMAAVLYWAGIANTTYHLFTPEAFYHPVLPMCDAHWVGWIALLAWALIVRFMPRLKSLNNIFPQILFLCISIAALWSMTMLVSKDNMRLWRLNHLAYTGQWDEILRLHSERQTNLIMMNYTNLALAHRHKLADQAFGYHPYTPAALMVQPNESGSVRMLLSDIHYAMGNIAESQRHAFEAMVSNATDAGVQCLERLVQTNIIQGRYRVAEKYIDMLSRTIGHSQWAEKQHRLLYNDRAVEEDAEYGSLRRCINKYSDRLAKYEGLQPIMEDVIASNGSFDAAREYLGMSILLQKDLAGFKSFAEKYYSNGCQLTMPRSFQEAVIVAYGNDEDAWRNYGVSQQVVENYHNFVRQYTNSNGNKQSLKQYYNTYWYYLNFVK